jgi:predicted negative regulator of RcsB-dependent stress response
MTKKNSNDDDNDIDIQQMRDVKLCENTNYKIIINLIIIGIIIFFIWYVVRKNYVDDDEQINSQIIRNPRTPFYPST